MFGGPDAHRKAAPSNGARRSPGVRSSWWSLRPPGKKVYELPAHVQAEDANPTDVSRVIPGCCYAPTGPPARLALSGGAGCQRWAAFRYWSSAGSSKAPLTGSHRLKPDPNTTSSPPPFLELSEAPILFAGRDNRRSQ